MAKTTPDDEVRCPFCDEGDFDLIGLRIHLYHNWCDAYNDTPLKDQKPLTSE